MIFTTLNEAISFCHQKLSYKFSYVSLVRYSNKDSVFEKHVGIICPQFSQSVMMNFDARFLLKLSNIIF